MLICVRHISNLFLWVASLNVFNATLLRAPQEMLQNFCSEFPTNSFPHPMHLRLNTLCFALYLFEIAARLFWGLPQCRIGNATIAFVAGAWMLIALPFLLVFFK
jgi:hypothetical protein